MGIAKDMRKNSLKKTENSNDDNLQDSSTSPFTRSGLDERLEYVKSLALSMGKCAEETLMDARSILLHEKKSDEVFPTIKKREDKINSLQVQISKICFKALARQAPVAKDLRLILAILSASTDLERMGDLSINIAHRFQKIDEIHMLKDFYSQLEKMFNSTINIVQYTLDAFAKESIEKSKHVLEMDDVVDSSLKQIREEAKIIMKEKNDFIPTCVEFIIIGGSLERIADHSTNIAEEIIFLQTGRDIRHRNVNF